MGLTKKSKLRRNIRFKLGRGLRGGKVETV